MLTKIAEQTGEVQNTSPTQPQRFDKIVPVSSAIVGMKELA